MKEVVIGQLIFFGASIVFGMAVLLIYDVIRGFRRVISHTQFWVSLEDIMFWIATGIMTFHFLYRYNQGQLRGFFFFGLLIGMFAYYFKLTYFVLPTVTKGLEIICIIPRKITRMGQHFFRANAIRFKWQLKKDAKEVKMSLRKRHKRGGNVEDEEENT